MLKQLWQSLQQTVSTVTSVDTDIGFEPEGSFWRSIGFKSGDPLQEASHYKSRCLGLLCLMYMSEVYQPKLKLIIARMHGPVCPSSDLRQRIRSRSRFSHLHLCVLILTRKLAEALPFVWRALRR